MSEKLIDYIDQNLPAEEMLAVKEALAQSPELQEEYEALISMTSLMDTCDQDLPSNRLQENFTQFLDQQVNESHDDVVATKTFSLRPLYKYAVAAVGLILLGVLVGQNMTKDQQIDSLSDQLYTLLEEKGTGDRMRAVSMSYDIQNPSDGIINALISTMNNDKSSNVRLAAVQALEKYIDQDKVVDAFVGAISKQEDPTVTIALINILANIKEQKAILPLEQLLDDEKHMQFVKDEAQVGLFKLTTI